MPPPILQDNWEPEHVYDHVGGGMLAVGPHPLDPVNKVAVLYRDKSDRCWTLPNDLSLEAILMFRTEDEIIAALTAHGCEPIATT